MSRLLLLLFALLALSCPTLAEVAWRMPRAAAPLPPEVAAELQYLLRQKAHIERTLARARPMIRLIRTELRQRQLPEWLLLVPLVESSYRLDVISHAGAAGPWQLMPMTADRFGVPVTPHFDGRYSLPLATGAALNYFHWLHRYFSEWPLALAAYNAGEGRVMKAIQRSGHRQVYRLPLPQETRHYVARIEALGELLSHPERYGITPPDLGGGEELRVANPKHCSLQRWGEEMRLDSEILLALNPAWRSSQGREPSPPCPILYSHAPAGPREGKSKVKVIFPVSLESLHDPLQLGTARGLDMEGQGGAWRHPVVTDPLRLHTRPTPLWR